MRIACILVLVGLMSLTFSCKRSKIVVDSEAESAAVAESGGPDAENQKLGDQKSELPAKDPEVEEVKAEDPDSSLQVEVAEIQDFVAAPKFFNDVNSFNENQSACSKRRLCLHNGFSR